MTGRWLIELLHQGGIRIKQPFKCQGVNTSTWDQINWNSVLPVWSDTFISHTDIVTHSFPDVLRMSHLPTRNILKLRIWHIEGKCRVRKTPDDLLNGCRTLLLCENQSLGDFNAGATDVLSLLFWNDQRGGYHQSFRLCWTPQGFMTRSIETFHLWIFCTIKCCSQEVLGKKKSTPASLPVSDWMSSFIRCLHTQLLTTAAGQLGSKFIDLIFTRNCFTSEILRGCQISK